MNPQQEPLNIQEENELNLGEIFRIVRMNWYWFALSIIVCATLAFAYLKWTPKVYIRTATVLIKDDNKGSGSISEGSAFADLGMFNRKSNVDNEILVFQAKQLMHGVVRRLELDVSYTMREGIRTVELYTKSPVHLSFPDAEPTQTFSLRVMPINKNEVSLSVFETDKAEEAGPMTVLLNDTVQTPFGRVVVTPTLYYTDIYYKTSIDVDKRDREVVALQFSQALQVSLASKTATIINLTLQDISTARAEDVINSLIAIYNEEAVNDKNLITVNTSEFINERLIIIEQELGHVDANIETFKRENRLTDIISETGMYLKENSEYNKEGLGLENQHMLAHFIREYLMDTSKSQELIPANTGITDTNLESQISEYNNLLLKRDRLISNSSDKNPVVMDLNNSILAMKQSIVRSVDNLLVSLNIQMKNIQMREAQTNRRISAVPGQQKQVLTIERQQKIKEELYLYLLNKREENALSQAITESSARIIDPATGSKVPVSPKGMMVMLVALVLGCMIPAGIFWLLQMLDTKIHTKKELEDKTTIPLLGEIPECEREDKVEGQEIVISENSRNAVSEAFRIVRTNLDFMHYGTESAKVVMVTSYNPEAGKSFISSNLAMSFALLGKKVILVDLDIRRGILSKRLKVGGLGVTHYLSGKITNIDEMITRGVSHECLDVICTGPIPPNPAELLLNSRLNTLIEELKVRYDYVILDNTPATMVADATIVSRVADLTIYIVRAGKFDRRQLPELERMYRQEKFKNLCLILNCIQYRGKGYHYGYGYGYGYDEVTDGRKK